MPTPKPSVTPPPSGRGGLKNAAQAQHPKQGAGYIITDPKGVVDASGKRHPKGTPVEEISASTSQLQTWKRFQQIGLAPLKKEAR